MTPYEAFKQDYYKDNAKASSSEETYTVAPHVVRNTKVKFDARSLFDCKHLNTSK